MLQKANLLLLILAISLIASNLSAQIVEDGLVSYWSFDANNVDGKRVKDGTGNYSGTINGSLKKVAGKIGDALEFDGIDANFVEIDSPEEFDFNADFTWSAWIKTDSSGPGVIFAKTGGPGTDDKGPKTLWVRNGVLNLDTGWVGNVEDAGNNIDDNKWHHIAVVGIPEDSVVQYFVDGEETSEGVLNLAQFPEDEWASIHMFIGLDGRADGEFGVFTGIIDEFSVYNRVLDEAEVNQNFSSDTGLAVEPNDKLAVTWGTLKAR
ncbi:MAG: LamG domain-containing protein [Candidatus Poribacteria bacterium]|nr:LamG domain-containing protein [Candidatus Poribacteria bacterium]